MYIYICIYIYTIQLTSPCPTARSCHPASSVVPSAQQTVTKVVVLFRCPGRRQNGMTWMISGVYIYIYEHVYMNIIHIYQYNVYIYIYTVPESRGRCTNPYVHSIYLNIHAHYYLRFLSTDPCIPFEHTHGP